MDRLIATRSEDRVALLPRPGASRRLRFEGSEHLRYPASACRATGPVTLHHAFDGSVEISVDPVGCRDNRGRLHELFTTGTTRFSNPVAFWAWVEHELRTMVTVEDLQRRASSGQIPMRRMGRPVSRADLYAALTRGLVGQDESLARLSASVALHLRKARPSAPYSAMLLGPTGVGKTSASIALARALDDLDVDPWRRVHIDCGEITGLDQVNRVIGAAPGYVGFEAGAPLTDAFQDSSAVLVLDEIEKAHPALINHVLLGLLDRGELRSARGQTVDARRSIVLFTSNLGADLVRGTSDARCRTALRRAGLRPELVGRLSDCLMFGALDAAARAAAVSHAVRAWLAEFDLHLGTIDSGALADLLAESDEASGVRGVRTALHARLSDSLTDLLDNDPSASVVDLVAEPTGSAVRRAIGRSSVSLDAGR